MVEAGSKLRAREPLARDEALWPLNRLEECPSGQDVIGASKRRDERSHSESNGKVASRRVNSNNCISAFAHWPPNLACRDFGQLRFFCCARRSLDLQHPHYSAARTAQRNSPWLPTISCGTLLELTSVIYPKFTFPSALSLTIERRLQAQNFKRPDVL